MQGRQGAGRVQGQGTEGRAGLQDSIFRFSTPENLKSRFCNFLRRKGKGGAGQHRARAKARAKGRAGCRAGRAQAGCRGLQDSILRFQGLKTSKSRFCNFEKKGEGRGRAAQGQGQGQG